MLSNTIQIIGLILDIVGILMIANCLRKTEDILDWIGHYANDAAVYVVINGIPTNTSTLFTQLANALRKGTYFLIVGFIVQLVGVWL